MTEFKRYLKEYAERELRLIGFMNTEFGKTSLKFLEDLADIADNNPEIMKAICDMFPRLIDKKPLSEITEADFETESFTKGNKTVELERCTRYHYLYKHEGQYWDDRAIAFKKEGGGPNDIMYIYQGNISSKQQVALPYFPLDKIEKL